MSDRQRDDLRAIVKHLAAIAPTWALLPWDFAANVYFGEVVIQPDRNDQRWLL